MKYINTILDKITSFNELELIAKHIIGKENYDSIQKKSGEFLIHQHLLRKVILLSCIGVYAYFFTCYLSIIFKFSNDDLLLPFINNVKFLFDLNINITELWGLYLTYFIIFRFLICFYIIVAKNVITSQAWSTNQEQNPLDERDRIVKNHYYKEAFLWVPFLILGSMFHPLIGLFSYLLSFSLPEIIAFWNAEEIKENHNLNSIDNNITSKA